MRRALLPVLLLASCAEPSGGPQDEPELVHLALVIDTPAPGTWHAVGEVEVAGTADNVDQLSLAGGSVSLADGAFSGSTTLVRGTNMVTVSGVSKGGTTYTVHNGVIAGPTADPEEPVAHAAAVRINEPGLDLALGIAAAALDGPTIEGLLVAANPVYESTGDTEVTVTATSFGLDGAALALDPQAGSADLQVTLSGLSLGVDVEGRADRLTFSGSQTVTVTQAVLTGSLGVQVVDGAFVTTLTDVDVALTGFALDTSDWPSWLTGSLTDLILTEVVEGVLRVAIADLVPPIVDEQLNSLDLSVQLTLLERPAAISALVTDATFDPDGLAVDVTLDVSIDGTSAVQAPGYLAAPQATPTVDTTAELAVGLADDLLNLAAFEAWRAGLLSYTLSTDDGSLPPYVLDALGGARRGIVSVDAELPPTIVEVDGGLRAQVGELRVRLDTIDGVNGEYVIMAVGGHIDLDLAVVDGVVKLGFGDKQLNLTVRDTDWSDSLPRAQQQVAELLPLEAALLLLQDLEIPLPTFAGLGVGGATVSRDVSGVHTGIAVDLVVIEE